MPAYFWRLGAVTLTIAFCSSSGALELARLGQTIHAMVQAERVTEPERFAARELADFLGRVTGASFRVVSEASRPAGAPGIYVGWTAYAAEQGIEAASLGEEEWVIRTVGDCLILTGGRPRGTLYAVYEFLERSVGCHWLDRETEIVPRRATLTVGTLDVRAKPRFWIRDVHSPTGCPDDHWRFLVRNKTCRYDFHGRADFFPQGAFYPLEGLPRKGGHTFSYYVNAKDWFATHPEYFALDAGGKRLPAYDGGGPGQLCLAHPDVRRLTVERLREFVAQDRAAAAASGRPPPKIYSIGQNDKYDTHCKCEACQAIARREGSESGPLIDYLNFVGAAIEKDHPDILLQTYAYNLTQRSPKTLRPRANVQIGWCDVYSRSDVLRPLTDPANSKHYQQIRAWGEIAPRLGIGDDYWILLGFYNHFPLPWTMVQCLGPDLRHFADCHAETFFAESGDYLETGQNFVALKLWLGYQLLVNPHQTVEPLIETFLAGYYGDAAPDVRRYLDYLTERIRRDAQVMLVRSAPHELAYLDLAFFRTSQELFDKAAARVASGSLAARHVQRERFTVDGALLFLWPWLECRLPPGEAMPFDKETIIRRYEAAWRAHAWYSRWFTEDKDPRWNNPDGKLRERMVALFRNSQLPEAFRNRPPRDVADFNWLTFSSVRPSQKFVVDPRATGGMAAQPAAISAILAAEKEGAAQGAAEARPTRALTFGVTGGPTITLPPERIPQDGAYHLYQIGPVEVRKGPTRDIPSGTLVWALEGQKLGVFVDRVHEANPTDPRGNLWDAYISLKVTGPAFVRGSTEANGVWMDRVLLVRPQPGDRADAVSLRQRQDAAKPNR